MFGPNNAVWSKEGQALNRAYDAAQHQLIDGVRTRIEKAIAEQAPSAVDVVAQT